VIDLHAHILPAIDDGPTTMVGSYEMALLAVEDGRRTIVATPHVSAERPWPDLERRVDSLREALAAEGLDLEVLPGGEIALSPPVPALLADRVLPTLNRTRYALIELAFEVPPPRLERQLFDLQVAGLVPILAHVERYRYAQREPGRLDDWCARGAVLQIDAASLRGDFGARARQAAEHVVRRALPAVVATDAHDAADRSPYLAFARAIVASLAGAGRATELFDEGPRAVLTDRPFPAPARAFESDPSADAALGAGSKLRQLVAALGRLRPS
jgi:protein-tyrosine phosphatase